MRTHQWELEGKPVAWILERAQSNIRNDEARGGDHAVWARSDRRILDAHPAPSEAGQPCLGCGDPWPCGQVLGLFAMD